MAPGIFYLGPVFRAGSGTQEKNAFCIIIIFYCFPSPMLIALNLNYVFISIATVQFLQPWPCADKVLKSQRVFPPFSQHFSTTPGGQCVLAWLWEPRQPQILSQELFEVFPQGLLCQGGHDQVRGQGWVVPRVLSLRAPSQEQDFWETSLCFHAGSVPARGCWHFDVSWRYSGEVALEKWQHETLINVSKESQPERFPLSRIHFHM